MSKNHENPGSYKGLIRLSKSKHRHIIAFIMHTFKDIDYYSYICIRGVKEVHVIVLPNLYRNRLRFIIWWPHHDWYWWVKKVMPFSEIQGSLNPIWPTSVSILLYPFCVSILRYRTTLRFLHFLHFLQFCRHYSIFRFLKTNFCKKIASLLTHAWIINSKTLDIFCFYIEKLSLEVFL